MKNSILVFSAFYILSYLLTSFIMMNFNPSQWDVETRLAAVIVPSVLSFMRFITED